MPDRRIAIGVDDFGLHGGINRATLALAAVGRLNAVGCLVGTPEWPAGCALLHGIDRQATDVGLHLDLTQYPLQLRAPWRLPLLIAGAGLRALPVATLCSEIAAQLDAFESALGHPPDFIDGHQHVHQLPQVRDALIEVLLSRGGRLPSWVRNTRRSEHATVGGLKAWLIETLGAQALSRGVRARGMAQNRHLLGVWNFQGDAVVYERHLVGWLRAAVDGDLLMCHPSEPVVGVDDAILAGRCAEWQVLSGPRFEALLKREGIALAPISRSAAAQTPSAWPSSR